MSDDISEQDLWEKWDEMAVELRTKSVIRNVLLALCHMVITEKRTVVDLRKLLEKLAIEPQKGVGFFLRFDDFLRSEFESNQSVTFESKRSVVIETFVKEIDDFIDLLSPEREEEMSEQYKQIRNDFSRQYGQDSAWN